MSEDFIESRSNVRPFTIQPADFMFRLNGLKSVQAVNNFVSAAIDTVMMIIPFQVTFNHSSYIENSMRLTRYRNHSDLV